MDLNKILHLTLKKKWFDMIASGVKKEEYREIKKYWVSRLCNKYPQSVIAGGDIIDRHKGTNYDFRNFNFVCFKNGYAKNAPTMTFECNGIKIGKPHSTWTNDKLQKDCFIILLGRKVGRN